VLPGKKYTPEDILQILARRAWLIAGLFAICMAGTAAVSRALVDKYRSETLIMVVPQRVPDAYVKAAVDSMEDRLQTISQHILSRSRLERIIVDLNLYEDLRQTEVMEDVVQRMRRDIDIPPIGKADTSFRVTYVSRDARTAQEVTTRLASLFIEENMRERENLAEDTNQFLDSQLEDARRRLIENEKKLENYRRQYSGQLPSQAPTNLQAIQNTQQQLQSLSDAMNREREHRLLVERQLVDLESPDPLVAATTRTAPTAPTGAQPDESTARQLEAARARLQVLETRLKPDHPDLRMLQRAIRDLEAKQQAELRVAAPPEPVPEKPPTPSEILRERRIRELKDQIAHIDRDLDEKRAQQARLQEIAASYQAKLEAVPTRESELVELTRDYTTVQATYQNLLAKREDAGLAANLQRRNIGEQFKILDPARVPERPFSPNRVLIYLGGAGGGLALVLALIAFLEFRDSTLKSEADITRLFRLPVLAIVPNMISSDERRSRRRRVLLGGIAGVVLLAAGSAAGFLLWGGRF
jgi:polysaccharide chain length determinant protein (PEP-CTERM system associated)